MKPIEDSSFEWNEPLWKYYKVARFSELMETSTIYFASAFQFEDRFEGAVKLLPNGFRLEDISPAFKQLDNSFKALKRLTKISCWHREDYESCAMWKLYAGAGKGVAVCTTPDRIRQAAKSFRLDPKFAEEQLWGGNVKYVDLQNVRIPHLDIGRFFFKHRAFAWEKEYRLAISLRLAEEFGVKIPDRGINVMFELDVLIDKIVLGPNLEESEVKLIEDAARKRGLLSRVQQTSLLNQPIYV